MVITRASAVKALIWLAAAAALICLCQLAAELCNAQVQVGNYGIRYQSNSPAGQVCGSTTPLTIQTPAGQMYTCQNGIMTEAGGGGGAQVYPAAGVAVSTGSAWAGSINPATLATWPPAGVPVSTGSAWSTSINPSTLATWPPPTAVCAANPGAAQCMDYIPIGNVGGTGWTGVLNGSGQITIGPGTATAFTGPIFVFSWPSTATSTLLGGYLSSAAGYANQGYRSIQNTGIASTDVARLSVGQLYTQMPSATQAPAIPATWLTGMTNDFNTSTWCGFFRATVSTTPANSPPNILTNNAAGLVPFDVDCSIQTNTTNAQVGQIVFDGNQDLAWLRTRNGPGTWTVWSMISTHESLTVATLPTCSAANQNMTAAVTDASSPSFLGTLTGGSTTYTPVVCNGTAWVAY